MPDLFDSESFRRGMRQVRGEEPREQYHAPEKPKGREGAPLLSQDQRMLEKLRQAGRVFCTNENTVVERPEPTPRVSPSIHSESVVEAVARAICAREPGCALGRVTPDHRDTLGGYPLWHSHVPYARAAIAAYHAALKAETVSLPCDVEPDGA